MRLTRRPGRHGLITATLSVLTAVALTSPVAAADQPQVAPGGHVVAWGTGPGTAVPAGLDHVIAVAAGVRSGVALRSDGTLIGWGDGQVAQVPKRLKGVTAVAAGAHHALALREDGTVAAWGDNAFGQTQIPAGLREVKAIAAGANHNLALRTDGSIVGWGLNDHGQATIPKPLRTTGPIVAIAAGRSHSLALGSDGTVYTWGGPGFATAMPRQPLSLTDQVQDLPGIAANLPARLSLTPITAIAAGGTSLALRKDGTVLEWGSRSLMPPTVIGAVAIATGDGHSLAIRHDGTIVGWGSDNSYGQADPPLGLTGVTAIAAAGRDDDAGAHSLAVTTSPLPTLTLPRPQLS